MAQVISLRQARARTFRDKGGNRRTPFFDSTPDTPDTPLAFLMEYEPSYVTLPHLHLCDQWQVIIGGAGKLGRRDALPFSIHYTRACTPYGPVVGGEREGLAFFVLFSGYQPGAQYLPGARAILDAILDRKPWQITRKVDFPVLGADEAARIEPVPDAEHPEGMFARSVTMAPGASAAAPDPSRGNGQYIVVVKGSLLHDGGEHEAPALVHVARQDGPFMLHAGKDGLEAMVLNFSRAGHDTPAADAPLQILGRWQCSMCSFTYDERDGHAERYIAAGTRWDALPDDWTCPRCASAKKTFRPF